MALVADVEAIKGQKRRQIQNKFSSVEDVTSRSSGQKNLLLAFVIILLMVSTLTTLTLLDSIPERRVSILSQRELQQLLRGQRPSVTTKDSQDAVLAGVFASLSETDDHDSVIQPVAEAPSTTELPKQHHHNSLKGEPTDSRLTPHMSESLLCESHGVLRWVPVMSRLAQSLEPMDDRSLPPYQVEKDTPKMAEVAKGRLSRGPSEKFLERVITDKVKRDGKASGKYPPEWLENFTEAELAESEARSVEWAEEVREAMRHVWKGYKKAAWGEDEIAPETGRPGRRWCNAAVTMLDSLSTLKIMGLEEEFDEATEWIKNNLEFDTPRGLHSFFEITIRVLGGLLSAHSLSGRQVFLDKAREAADHMMTGFSQSAGCPHPRIDLGTGHSSGNGWMSGFILAEVGTIQLEFRYLTEQTGDHKYAEAADKCQDFIFKAAGSQGLVPYELASDRPMFTGSVISLGAMGDSYFEYLLKVWLQSNKTEEKHLDYWVKTMTEVEKMIFTTDAGLTFVGELRSGSPRYRMEHLTCFIGGNLMLGARTLPRERVDPRWEKWARDITETCHQMYARSKTGLGPEVAEFNMHAAKGEDLHYKTADAHYILRPEVIESIFYMHYFTGDPKYRVWAHEMMSALNKHAKVEYGYSAVYNINEIPAKTKNEQESFFTAETLKYLYLTLAPRHVLNLDEYVLNTEAHPLKIVKQQ
ncbi:Mannosyl-oligosaccharide 1,2-alpha-mannosidase IB [Perkinsus chesapeaki]|uniref:alpha-1,2-Mannosidase n=1 Tax=Perkinsus chesapeaki TaxID=330153 RepID=A0A7J6MKG8_PERCH|nr:Mannosyl-oligosaccharide 1,2-alpha-mannosidase IB [Perkinsus chesapeaki]